MSQSSRGADCESCDVIQVARQIRLKREVKDYLHTLHCKCIKHSGLATGNPYQNSRERRGMNVTKMNSREAGLHAQDVLYWSKSKSVLLLLNHAR